MSSSFKTALITGAARGIGAATALALASRGITVVLTARSAAACRDVAERIQANGGRCHVTACDVADYPSVVAAVEAAVAYGGGLDIIVNNAGQIQPIGLLHTTDPAQWTHAIHTNLVGAYHVIHAALPWLQKSAHAAIVNLSTGGAHTPRLTWSSYCSAKAGLAMLTRCVADEYADRDVAVYGLQPGLVDTGMQATIRAAGTNAISRIPQSELDPPEKSAAVIAWLADQRPTDLRGLDLSATDAALLQRSQASTL